MEDPLSFYDDWGEEIVLTKVAPALLADLLRDATFRAMEHYVGRQMGEKDEEYAGRRVCIDQVRSQLRSDRKISPAGRAAYLSVACNAVMTYSRAEAGGYLVENRCPLCGMRGDDLRHRIWECQHPEVVAARAAAAPAWLREEVGRRPRTQTRWCNGFIPHPGDVWPRPAAEATPVAKFDGDGERPMGDDGIPILGNKIYVDGSCTSHVVSEIKRAATSIVSVDCHGGTVWRVLMPVPAPMPQTSQSAEFVALPLVKAYLTTSSDDKWDVASDCLNVVRACNEAALRAIDGARKYAGVMKPIMSERIGGGGFTYVKYPPTLTQRPCHTDPRGWMPLATNTRMQWPRRQSLCILAPRPCNNSNSPLT